MSKNTAFVTEAREVTDAGICQNGRTELGEEALKQAVGGLPLNFTKIVFTHVPLDE